MSIIRILICFVFGYSAAGVAAQGLEHHWTAACVYATVALFALFFIFMLYMDGVVRR